VRRHADKSSRQSARLRPASTVAIKKKKRKTKISANTGELNVPTTAQLLEQTDSTSERDGKISVAVPRWAGGHMLLQIVVRHPKFSRTLDTQWSIDSQKNS